MAKKKDKQEKPPPKSFWDSFAISQVDTDEIDPDQVDVTSDAVKGTGSAVRPVPKPRPQTDKQRPPSVRRSGQSKSPARRSPAEADSSNLPKRTPRKKSRSAALSARKFRDDDAEQVTIPPELGILALRNAVIFPGTVIPLAVGRRRSRRLLTEVLGDESSGRPAEKVMGVLTQKDPSVEVPDFDNLYSTGTVVAVLKQLRQPDGNKSVVAHGLVRFRVVEWLSAEPYLRARIEVVTSEAAASKELDALVTSVRHTALKMVQLSPNIPEEVNVILSNIDDAGALADFLAANINIPSDQKQQLLETIDVTERLKKLSVALAHQVELLELSAKIQERVSQSIDKTQREYFLQEQLKAIQTELGQTDQKSADVDQLKKKISAAQMPQKVETEALRELDRLSQIPTMSPEYSVLRSYIECLCELPWSKSTKDKLHLNSARRILNADHYNLTKVKKRILEFLAVRKLNPQGRSIARSMGRKFVRISLGGIRDEADIRGHRRTYIGALPGRIVQEIRKCQINNPVFMLDELDKIGQDFRGDPASALLEVLDPEQNNTFTDHYIALPFDLSRVMFIGTANYMGAVPPALRDRMEVLELCGYTAPEKLAIARRYLLPRQLKENGLTSRLLTIKTDALEKLIESYTREAGVRELERQIAAICRAVAAEVASGKRKSAVVSDRQLSRWLGPVRYESEVALRTGTPGVATGLAYTPVGGEVLFVESTVTPGSGKLILTGQLGEVMKESAQAALSILKSQTLSKKKTRGDGLRRHLSQSLGQADTLKQQDIHIHVPAGAVPKDGPSAGLAIYTSLASLFCEKPVRADVAMTGEVTLRGLVMPIGGVKEKLLAAKRAGIRTVILPARNRKDLVDLPKDVIRGLKMQFVRNVDKVLTLALESSR